MSGAAPQAWTADRPCVTPVFDKTTAVKMISWDGNQWAAYDDGDTFKIKTDFAKSQCLGGVMVWAASQDTSDGEMAQALAEALGSTSISLSGGIFRSMSGSDATENQKNYCSWAPCNEECPYGYAEIEQNDNPGQLMKHRNTASRARAGCGVPRISLYPVSGRRTHV